MSLFPCPEFIFVGEEEPFHIRHGWEVTPGEHLGIGEHTFELSQNGEIMPPTRYTAVTPGVGTVLTRWFVFEFSGGLVTDDVVEGFWYNADGLDLYCMSTVVNGDPPE